MFRRDSGTAEEPILQSPPAAYGGECLLTLADIRYKAHSIADNND